jgi:predicted DNA-binding transcriptional regulator AlpA
MLKKYFAENELPLMLNVSDVAGILGISRAFAYNLFHAQDFPVIVIGKRRIVKKDSFLNWLQEKEGRKNKHG